MNKWILSAALLSLLTVFIHLIGGGFDVHQPLMNTNLSTPLKAIISVLWHGISAILIINTLLLFQATYDTTLQNNHVLIVSVQYLAFGLIFIFYDLSMLGNLLAMPQWIIFFLMSLLAVIGIKTQHNKPSEGTKT